MSRKPVSLHGRALWPPTDKSKVLASFGLVYCGLGLLYICNVTSPSLKETLALALRWIPLQVYGVMSMVAGLTAVLTAALRWHKQWGFTALWFAGAIWGMAFLFAWITGHSSPTGTPFGLDGVFILVYAAVFWLLCVAIKAVSRMLDPREVQEALIPTFLPGDRG